MQVHIIEEKENPVLKRREVVASLDYDGQATVSRAVLQKTLADEMKTAIDSIEITKILSETGVHRGKAWIKVWKEKKVPIYSEVKKEKPAEGETPKEEPKAETPKEDAKKEEKPAEAPKEEPAKEEPMAEEPKKEE